MYFPSSQKNQSFSKKNKSCKKNAAATSCKHQKFVQPACMPHVACTLVVPRKNKCHTLITAQKPCLSDLCKSRQYCSSVHQKKNFFLETPEFISFDTLFYMVLQILSMCHIYLFYKYFCSTNIVSLLYLARLPKKKSILFTKKRAMCVTRHKLKSENLFYILCTTEEQRGKKKYAG